MDPIVAPLPSETTVFATLLRNGRQERVVVGGGTRLERIHGAMTILRWNREGKRAAAQNGTEFPADAPTHLWQVNWPSVFNKGNV